MSQRELARRSGVHQSSISRFERGLQFCIRWSRFARIVVVLGGLDFDLDGRDAMRPAVAPSWNALRAESLVDWLAEWRVAEEAIRREQADERVEAAALAAEDGPDPVEGSDR
jgi:transcriptional regulator with XRE-family HTH domain